ncbi:MAG: glycosyltransferase family 2 protein [bacterium]
MTKSRPILSIVTTLYNSSPYIDEFYQRITKEARKITDDYEIIFVDDGSPDDSLNKAINLCNVDDKVKVVELSRNFGHHKAIMLGLSLARGEYIFLIDVDLEEEPELLAKFWEEMQKDNDIDVVYGVQEKRKGNWFEKLSGEIFYWIYNKIADVKIPRNFTTCRLMKKNYKDALISYREREMVLAVLLSMTGFKQKELAIRKLYRGNTNYTLPKKVSIFITSIVSSSAFPLYIIFYIGLFICIFSFLYALWIIYRKIFYGVDIAGWSSIMVSIWFLGGIIILFIGVVGIYISKIFLEVKRRPNAIIRKIYTKGCDARVKNLEYAKYNNFYAHK